MVLIIDNYDSFTFNLARYFEELDCRVSVIKNDQLTLAEIIQLAPEHVVISPGPCTPNESGISKKVIEYFSGRQPVLGVCLGHQAIGELFGARLMRAPNIKHGKTSVIKCDDQSALFKAIPTTFKATRYHSLILDHESIQASDLKVVATCEETGTIEIMAIEHKTLPIFGVQFHPESLLTEHGHKILANFLNR